MKKPFLITLFCLLSFICIAQLHPKPISYRTGFFNSYQKKPDTALFFARKLAADTSYDAYLYQALQEDFMSSFADTTRVVYRNKAIENKVYTQNWEAEYDKFLVVVYRTLRLMATDKNKRLSDISTPMYTWATIQQKLRNREDAKAMVASFIKDQLSKDNIYESMTGRYALLIYSAINTKPDYQNQANELLLATIDKLYASQVNGNSYSLRENLLQKRALFRYDYATANNYMAKRLIKKGEVEKAGTYFKTAAEYSPDLSDLNDTNILFYEMLMFSNRRQDLYNLDYLNFLQTYKGDKQETLSALTNMAIKQPLLFISQLKSFYAKNFKEQQDFQPYWEAKINAGLDNVPTAMIKISGKVIYPLLDNANKWTLIDFWGTWCTPCRQEHPDLQELYINAKKNFPDKINIVTIACNDTQKSVNDYMAKFKYSFPVALNVDNLSRVFNVLGYPTKILITPGGKYLKIPYGVDWVNFIKQYASL